LQEYTSLVSDPQTTLIALEPRSDDLMYQMACELIGKVRVVALRSLVALFAFALCTYRVHSLNFLLPMSRRLRRSRRCSPTSFCARRTATRWYLQTGSVFVMDCVD
jgi:hypothetical protein